jgi:hypothetical protein
MWTLKLISLWCYREHAIFFPLLTLPRKYAHALLRVKHTSLFHGICTFAFDIWNIVFIFFRVLVGQYCGIVGLATVLLLGEAYTPLLVCWGWPQFIHLDNFFAFLHHIFVKPYIFSHLTHESLWCHSFSYFGSIYIDGSQGKRRSIILFHLSRVIIG